MILFHIFLACILYYDLVALSPYNSDLPAPTPTVYYLVCSPKIVGYPPNCTYSKIPPIGWESKNQGRKPIESDEGCRVCGQSLNNVIPQLIVNGQLVQPQHNYPWVAGLVMKGTTRKFCGSSILNEYFLLTAAHCLMPNSLIIKDLGGGQCQTEDGTGPCTIDAREMEVLFLDNTRGTIASTHMHPHFSAATPQKHDIGLVKLAQPIQCNDYKKPVCLPQAINPEDMVGHKVLITGWGQTESESGSDYLREAVITVADDAHCEQFGSFNDLTGTAYCMSGYEMQQGPCFGDSGGSMFLPHENKNYALAVATAVFSADCDVSSPSIYTSVSPYLSWISQMTG